MLKKEIKNKNIPSSKKQNSNPPHATVKKAVQKRINLSNKSSIIPGIDINELKYSLDLLKYALDYSEAIVDTIREPLVVVAKDFRILTANKSFYTVFHLDPEETENQSIYSIGKGQWNIPKLKTLLEKILPQNTHFDNFEVEYNISPQIQKVFLLSARRTYRQVNETEAILLAFEDITERKNVENQKDDFIGTISHELKSPLTSLLLFGELLQNHLKLQKDQKGMAYMEKLYQNLNKLKELMASFNNVYKIQTGKLKLEKTKFSLTELIQEVVSDFQYTTTTHQLINKVRINQEVMADKKRIRQVLVNVLSNAIKYSPKAKKIILSSEESDQKITIHVQDFGLGVAEADQSRIFSRFYRGSSETKRKISGLGLGLYISSQIIKQHKGKMWFKSTVGKGSSFYFSLPTA